MPFLRLTRDRRGFENTFLMHADHPGEKPRVLYWYRTAPGVVLGRQPLDEEAIRTIEEQHPHIEFDWPAILALSEVMTPEEEEAPRPPRQQKKPRREREERRETRDERPAEADASREMPGEPVGDDLEPEAAPPEAAEPAREIEPPRGNRLLDELVGREIATRLRARHSELVARIHHHNADSTVRDGWLKRAEALNPDLWVTPDAILEGVRNADKLFDQLRTELS